MILVAFANAEQNFWFQLPYVGVMLETVLARDPRFEFRGCYGSPVKTLCLVVGNKNIGLHGARLVQQYNATEDVWVLPSSKVVFGSRSVFVFFIRVHSV